MSKTVPFWALFFCFFSAPLRVGAQTPCNDTLVHYYDTICEGSQYDFNGRLVDYTALFFDTIPRHNPDCDSVIVLHLQVLNLPNAIPSAKALCSDGQGYRLRVSDDEQIPWYCTWSSQPVDPSLMGQEHNAAVIVNPSVPTTYFLTVDYSETTRCPSSGTKELNPLEPVVASMHVSLNEIDYSHLEFSCEDFSLGTREPRYGGWAGRNWYIDGVLQPQKNEFVTFEAKPWWGDSVVVMMEGYSNTCIDTAIKVLPFYHMTTLFPNIFTPSADNNNRFSPVLEGVLEYELWIYDRRGSLVFHTTDPEQSWDGTTIFGPCQQGVYSYRCRYRPVDTPTSYRSTLGTVTLVR